jgi:hypothetical protein
MSGESGEETLIFLGESCSQQGTCLVCLPVFPNWHTLITRIYLTRAHTLAPFFCLQQQYAQRGRSDQSICDLLLHSCLVWSIGVGGDGGGRERKQPEPPTLCLHCKLQRCRPNQPMQAVCIFSFMSKLLGNNFQRPTIKRLYEILMQLANLANRLLLIPP